MIIASIAIGASPFIVEKTSIETEAAEFHTNVTVLQSDQLNRTNLGVNADPSMRFGRIAQGTNFTKWVQVSARERSEVQVTSKGNITEIMSHERRFYFENSTRIPIQVKSGDPGYYEGRLRIEVRRPKNLAGKFWIEVREQLERLA